MRNGTLNLKTIIEKDALPPPPPQPAPPPDTTTTSVAITPTTVTPAAPSAKAKSAPDFIDICYLYMLGRVADSGGKAEYLSKLNQLANKKDSTQ